MTTLILNTKDTEKKIPDITNMGNKAALKRKTSEVESKITDLSNLTIKVALNTKATETEKKELGTTSFIITSDFYRLTKINLDARMKKATKNFASEVDNAVVIADKIK